MASVSFSATPRSTGGKGAARKLRQAGEVPAVIYGHGREPQALSLNARELDRLLGVAGAATVVELTVDGTMARTLIREVQRHPFKKQVLHVDFQELVAGEKITVNVPLRFVGTADGVRNSGGILEEIMHQIRLRIDPVEIPDHIDVDVTPLTVGHSFHVGDLTVPAGAEIMDDAKATVCVVSAPKAEVEVTPVVGEAVEAAAEPELIRKPKPEEGEEK